MKKKELSALISLLDDPDEAIYNEVCSKLLSMGPKMVIPDLEAAWEHCFDTLIQNRIENIIHKIQFDLIAKELKRWSAPENQNLLDGVLLIARYQYPDLDFSKVEKQIELIKHDVWLELNENLTALEKVKSSITFYLMYTISAETLPITMLHKIHISIMF